jgi:hypothetical protein
MLGNLSTLILPFHDNNGHAEITKLTRGYFRKGNYSFAIALSIATMATNICSEV